MKVIFKTTAIIGILFLPLMYGCSYENVVSSTSADPEMSEESLAKRLPSPSKKTRAIKVATEFLKSECVMETNAEWGKNGIITEAFPVYLDGVDDVSYYECKVQNGATDAGYILVNINQTDVLVPQYNTEGKAPSEDFARESGIAVDNLQVFRYNWFEMLAEKKTSIGLGDGTPVIARGFGKNGEFQKKTKLDRQQILLARNKFRQRVQQAGGVNPIYLKQNVRQLHSRDSLVVETLKKYPQEGLAKSAAKTKWTSDELNNTFSTGWHLPQWTQVRNTTNVLSGCGPLALAMMYAYHRQFTGKTKLFNGLDLNSNVPTPYGTYPASSTMGSYNQIIKDVAFQIGADCGANYGASGTGVNINALENDGELYGDRLGYDVHLDSDFGGDFTKGKTALGHIRGERPCMFQFDSDRNGSVDHYGAIEGVKYMERKYVWNWYNWEMWYLVNYGWGNTRQWICVDAQYSSNATEYKNTGNLYMEWR